MVTLTSALLENGQQDTRCQLTRQKWDIKVQTLTLTGAKLLFVVVLAVCDSWTLKAQALRDYQALDPFKLTLVANKSNQAEFALKATTFKWSNVFYGV